VPLGHDAGGGRGHHGKAGGAEALVEGEDEETPKVPLPELLQAVKQVIKEATKRFLVASAAPPSP